ncbi:hypothetical protein SAMN05421548_12890 [Paraburkholderia lycopersici]|uniref:Uncharacterized protein n=1 Tax=Paraburkholderia lycopersici TaxID=416944 RepID=A0A1G6YVG1_9BURK|nr:hypothetical protein SAMN05421548_12890 [Paraburkholderia lycopersici]
MVGLYPVDARLIQSPGRDLYEDSRFPSGALKKVTLYGIEHGLPVMGRYEDHLDLRCRILSF